MKKQDLLKWLDFATKILFLAGIFALLLCNKSHAQTAIKYRYVYPDTGRYTIIIQDTIQHVVPKYRLLVWGAKLDSIEFGVENFQIFDASKFIPDWNVLIPLDSTVFRARAYNILNRDSISGLTPATVVKWFHVESTVPPIPDTSSVLFYYVATTEQLHSSEWIYNETGPNSVDQFGQFGMYGFNEGYDQHPERRSRVRIARKFPMQGYYSFTVSVCAWPRTSYGHVYLEVDGRLFEIHPDNEIFRPYTFSFNCAGGIHEVAVVADSIDLVFEKSVPADGVYPLLISKQADFPPFRPLRVIIQKPN